MRPGASGARPRPPAQPDRFQSDRSSANNVYRPYNSAARSAGPRRLPDASARWDADPFGVSGVSGVGEAGPLTSAHMEAIHRKHRGFALFHDGNAGHLWRGEVASLVGEGALAVGIIIWLVYLTASPYAVLAAVVALGLPWLLVGPLSASFENAREPGRLLSWIGRVRVVAALGIVAMHFLTIFPLLYLLLFVIGASGRLRQSLRVAAMRVCLAPGEIELVTNDLYVGAAVASVVGPLLGTLLFLLLGDRIILVGLGAALLFLLAGNSDGFLDALPEAQRGFLQATLATVAPDDATRDDLLRAVRSETEDASADSASDDLAAPLSEEQRELALPEWYQQGPRNLAQALGDIRVGLGLAGGRKSSATGMLALLALALVGGGLTALEAFYLGDQLNLPALYLGIVIGIEGGGLALGALLASTPPLSKMGPRLTLIGLALTGVALAIFGAAPYAQIAFFAALGMGVANALAVTGARQALRAGRDGAERRAISAAEGFLTAGTSLIGALLFTVVYAGSSRIHMGAHALFPGLPLNLLFTLAGVGLGLIAFMLSVTPGLGDTSGAHKEDKGPVSKATQARMHAMADVKAGKVGGGLWDDETDDEMDDGPASRYSSAYPAIDDEDDERGYTDDYESYDDQPGDDWDDESPARSGPRRPAGGAGGRPPLTPRDRRNRR
ncbi:MAG TPA: hypothetical protein VE338_17305 [Ktedonobacterales bacterium]|jgi:hypothetical protein|nr:hypothetical protein [Ktedonobacterales bacterium]